jgi:hypothetical protein
MIANTKQQAMNLFERERAEYLAHCRDVAERLYNLHGPISIDQVREQCPPPEMFNAKVLGAVFLTEKWQKRGYEPTKIKSSHGRLVAIWELKPEYRQPAKTYFNQMALL